ncbi:MAG: hypothetical protein Q9226_005600 [Calogaya cf. arnoldii]
MRVGSPSRTAPPPHTQLFSTASDPPRSIAALPALHALLGEQMSYSTIQKTKRDAMDSGRASGMKEFEREPSEAETTSSVQSPSEFGSSIEDLELGLATPITTTENLAQEGPAEQGAGNDAVDPDLDFGFDDWNWTGDITFDDWFWTEEFSNDSMYG